MTAPQERVRRRRPARPHLQPGGAQGRPPAGLRPGRGRPRPPASTSGRATCAAQTRRTLENVRAILEAGGAGVEDVLMFRVYLTRRDDFAAMNEAYGAFVAEHVPSGVLPARTTVFVDLPHEVMLVEIDALAVTG